MTTVGLRPQGRWRTFTPIVMQPHRPPAIAFDARDLLIAQRTGVEWVAWQMLEHLPPQLPGVRRALVLDREDGSGAVQALARRGGYECIVLPPRWPRLQRLADGWMAWQIGPQLRARGFDLLVSVNTKLPLRGLPGVVTVHGLEWARVPADYTRSERLKQAAWLRLAAWRATAMLTFTQATLQDLRALLPRLRPPVAVIPEGVMPHVHPLPPAALDTALPARLGVPARPFVLSVCTLAPRKNLDGLLQAWAVLKQQRAAAGQPLQAVLVLAGRSGAASSRLQARVQQLGLQPDVVFTGYVGDDDLVQLYHQASAFAYPSRYEGFGLPPLEAMCCGTPVLSANRGAMAEVAGDAALLVDPDDVADIAHGLDRLLHDPALRARLRQAGPRRAAGFRWPAFAAAFAPFLLQQMPAPQPGAPPAARPAWPRALP